MKINKNIKFAFKIIVVLGAFAYIGYKLYHYRSSLDIHIFSQFSWYEVSLLVIVFGFMLINWLTESVKWKFLIRRIEEITIYRALKGIFAGITFAMITPNRTGELVGRVLVLRKENRGEAVIGTIVGSFSQSAVTIVMGCIGICSLLLFYQEKISIGAQKSFLFGGSVLLLAAVFLFFYFKIRLLDKWLGGVKWLKSVSGYFKILSSYKQKELFVAFMYSAIRYVVFSSQMILLFYLFKVDLSFIESLIVISATYLVSTIIPSITLAEFGIRGSVIIFFTETFTTDFVGAFSASIFLWVVNVAIPALLGTFVFSKLRF